jgi:ankyrin repeat protein
MGFLHLPTELLYWIADELDTAKDLLALSCITKETNLVLLPHLYRFNIRQQRSSALFWGALQRNSEFVGKMLGQYQANANTTDDQSRTPVFYAIDAENQPTIRLLLSDKRADINQQDQSMQTPLVYAIAKKRSSAVSPLLEFNPCLDKRDDKQRSAIWYAIHNRDTKLVQLLLSKGSDIRTPDNGDVSPIKLAITKKYVKITRMLLGHSDPNTGKSLLEDINAIDHLLDEAREVYFRDIILLLIAHGADPNTRHPSGWSVLHQATENQDSKMIEKLLIHRAAVANARDGCSRTPFQVAADINARDGCNRTPFQVAAEYGYRSIMGLFLTCPDMDIKARDYNGATALCLAVEKGHTKIAQRILTEDHVNINVANKYGETALHWATKTHNKSITAALLDNHDLDPNALDDQQWPSLAYAAYNGYLCLVELFLAGTKVNVPQAKPLFHAAHMGHVGVVRRLLCLDAINIDQQYNNESPLCAASARGHLEVAKLLLEHTTRPDINFRTYIGHTPLSLAASRGKLAVVDLLLKEEGLDFARDDFEETALCHAARNGYEEVVSRLYQDPRARNSSDVKRAIKVASNFRITSVLQGYKNKHG